MTRPPRISVVAGYGRCGSSLVMQMLSAGGLPVTGEWPAFEENLSQVVRRGWGRAHDGMAIKVLDPHHVPLPAGPDYRVLWLKRDPTQQARSHVKFLRTMAGIREFSRGYQREVRRSYRLDLPDVWQTWKRLQAPVLTLRFEDILRSGRAAAECQHDMRIEWLLATRGGCI